MGAEEGLVGDRECLWDTGLSGARYSCHGMMGDSSGDKVCVLPPGTSGSYGMNGSGSKCHGQTTVSDRVRGSRGSGISDEIMKMDFEEGSFPKEKSVT